MIERGKTYYYVDGVKVRRTFDNGSVEDDYRYEYGNYFPREDDNSLKQLIGYAVDDYSKHRKLMDMQYWIIREIVFRPDENLSRYTYSFRGTCPHCGWNSDLQLLAYDSNWSRCESSSCRKKSRVVNKETCEAFVKETSWFPPTTGSLPRATARGTLPVYPWENLPSPTSPAPYAIQHVSTNNGDNE